jgi:hypothetical protein
MPSLVFAVMMLPDAMMGLISTSSVFSAALWFFCAALIGPIASLKLLFGLASDAEANVEAVRVSAPTAIRRDAQRNGMFMRKSRGGGSHRYMLVFCGYNLKTPVALN